jgi:hypothetical protein
MKLPNIKFHYFFSAVLKLLQAEDSLIERQTYGRTDMAKIMDAILQLFVVKATDSLTR